MGGGYEAWDGTSMATPVVSGVAALILEKDPNLTIPELEDVIFDTCLDLRLPVERQGCGLVQVKGAI
jgi:subtilisin family serine protease